MSTPQHIGRYQVLGEIGRGGMGVVYRGWDPQLERPVAIKVISVEGLSGGSEEEILARFLRETKLAARIVHPGVVTVYDAGEQAGRLFLVMELVEGESLAVRLRRGDFPTRENALELVAEVAEALGAAHKAGIVHRDVKPANVLITKEGKAKVGDFGVAKAVGEATGLTRTGTAVGSPAYMSPEQVRGEQVDARSDLFSLGVMLYEMLFRKKPFPADNLTTLVFQILNSDPFADPQVFAGVDEEVVRFLKLCLAKNPAERIPDAATFAAQARTLAKMKLESTVSTMPTVAIDAAFSGQATVNAEARQKAGIRGPLIFGLGAGLFFLLAALGYLVLRRPSPPPAELLVAQAVPSPTTGPASEEPTSRGPEVVPAATPTPTQFPLPTPTPSPTPTPLPVASSPPVVVPPVVPTPTSVPAPTPPPVVVTSPPVVVPPVVPTPTSVPAPTPPPVVATYFGRSGAVFNVSPEETLVEVEGKVIGTADDWDGKGGGKVCRFPGPGTHYVRLSLPGYRAVWVAVVITPSAKDDKADVDWEMEEL